MFAWITWFCSALLIDAYRYPDVDGDKRNYTYIQAVKRYLGEIDLQLHDSTLHVLLQKVWKISSIDLKGRCSDARNVGYLNIYFFLCRWQILHCMWLRPM